MTHTVAIRHFTSHFAVQRRPVFCYSLSSNLCKAATLRHAMTEAAPVPEDAAAQTSPTTAAKSVVTASNTAPEIVYYPQYCFHLSPTLNQWCPMRVADVVQLSRFFEFEGQNVFFHLNHPIKWVRIIGIVIASAEYFGRRVYSIDDGSGAIVECVAPKLDKTPAKVKAGVITTAPDAASPPCDAFSIDDTGIVVAVKGELRLHEQSYTFGRRTYLQIQMTQLTVLRSTQQEVQFWAKVHTFAHNVLNKPWEVDKQTVRACRKAAREGRKQEKAKENKKKRETTETDEDDAGED